jgi:acetylglutamate kinase
VIRPLVVKFGGEMLDDPARLRVAVAGVRSIVSRGVPLAIVHGGGKEIDAALQAAGIPKHQVEGLRVTDDKTLDVVVSVLAGAVNTRFVAALTTAGVQAVGLTGADAGCCRVDPAPPHTTIEGRQVDLGRVGIPNEAAQPAVVALLASHGFVPVIACIGLGEDGRLFNVNADTMAGALAGRLGAERLVIAGTTAGVLDERGGTLAALDRSAIGAMIANGTATAGMIAKLRACEDAVAHGVTDVVIVDGRQDGALEAAAFDAAPPHATRLSMATASA